MVTGEGPETILLGTPQHHEGAGREPHRSAVASDFFIAQDGKRSRESTENFGGGCFYYRVIGQSAGHQRRVRRIRASEGKYAGPPLVQDLNTADQSNP